MINLLQEFNSILGVKSNLQAKNNSVSHGNSSSMKDGRFHLLNKMVIKRATCFCVTHYHETNPKKDYIRNGQVFSLSVYIYIK